MKAEWYLVVLMLVFVGCIFIIDWYIDEVYAEDSKYTIIDIEYINYNWVVICELTNLEPYYDCPESVDGYFDATGEEWMIFTLDDEVFPDPVGVSVYGFAIYSDTPGKSIPSNDPLSLCVFFPEFNGTNKCSMNYMAVGSRISPTCYSPYPCNTVFEHEIKHLTCKCDWHKGLTSKPMVIVI
jgi:hypothetical protein